MVYETTFKNGLQRVFIFLPTSPPHFSIFNSLSAKLVKRIYLKVFPNSISDALNIADLLKSSS